ncbi:glycosyltransferase family 2 protein [Pontibaca sp. S1109L]|uniref:Glycosyltransferase family 2 protein n=1 Tax=Pontibaca salina TaxID=2795731 RepID=A0A934M135_9RHOB|nr:glycosyltransferase family 2 protein [Pontibaca salina]
MSVVVAILTRDRPRMLKALLHSLASLQAPNNCLVRFLIVENNESNSQEETVKSIRPLITFGTIHYILETSLGIATARNTAAKEAARFGSDLLVFVDDDETVPTEWLSNLIDGYRESDAVLLGGPIRAAPLIGKHNWTERLMHRNIFRRYLRNERRAARQASLRKTSRTTIVTNNWIGQVSLFTDYKLRFDEKLNWSGGEDTKFYSDVRALKLTTGWIPDAPVYETIPRDRLTLQYQYNRAKDQSTTSFRKKLKAKRIAIYTLPVSVAIKSVVMVSLLLLIPVTLGATYLSFARTSGWIAGRISAIGGAKSEHYRTVTGE